MVGGPAGSGDAEPFRVAFLPLYRAGGRDEPLAFPQEREPRAGGFLAQNTSLLELTG